MLSKIKSYLLVIAGAFAVLLMALVGYQKKRADNAEQEAEEAKTEAMFAAERVKRHEERQEIENDIAHGDEPHIDERLQQYFRD